MLTERLSCLPRDTRDTLFLLLVIALVVLPQASSLPWWCTALTAAVLLWRGALAWWSRPLPARWWPWLLTALAIGATWFSYRSLLGRGPGVTLIVMLLALKTLELRARRDAYVVFFLGFFTMLTSFFHSQSLAMALGILLGLLGLLTALVNAHMPVGKPPLWQAMKTAGGMAILGAPVMVVLFLLFPRMAPLWGLPSDAATGRSGLSGSMQVGQVSQLALDDSIALRVRFAARPPAPRDMYFRGPVLSAFDGRAWQVSPFAGASGSAAQLQVSGDAVDYEVTLQPTMRPWLLVLDAAPAAPVGQGLDVRMTPELQWLNSQPLAELKRYQARSYVQFRHGPMTANTLVRANLDLTPGLNPRTRELAQQLRAGLAPGAGARELVQAALTRLRTGGYVYTLEPGTYGADFADEFWFDRKQGFCEHIAAGFVVLMRASGVPARIVTGYQGGELNGLDGFWVVRNSDAHAWAEVWEPGVGWWRVDPTAAVAPGRVGAQQRLVAPQGAVAGALTAVLGNVSPDFLLQLRTAWEAANNRWNQWVLDYGQTRQFDMLRKLGFSAPDWEDLILLLCGVIAAAGGAGALWALWERRQGDPWLRLLWRAYARLRAAGMPVSPQTAPRQATRWLAQRADAEHTGALQAWLLRLEAQRYAPAAAVQAKAQLFALQREFARLPWPAA